MASPLPALPGRRWDGLDWTEVETVRSQGRGGCVGPGAAATWGLISKAYSKLLVDKIHGEKGNYVV